MKIVILNSAGLVVAAAISPTGWASLSHPNGVRELILPESSPVGVGWQHNEPAAPSVGENETEPGRFDVLAVIDSVPAGGLVDLSAQFTPPQFSYPLIEATRFYLLFKTDERIKIKASDDPNVKEFWATYEIYRDSKQPIDPNSADVRNALAYFARATTAKPPGPGILATTGRIEEILSGQPPA